MTTNIATTSRPKSILESAAADLGLRIDEAGAGRTVLLLHGGGGPGSVAAFATDLSRRCHVVTPTHPGFAGTTRSAEMTSVKDLAQCYVRLLELSHLKDVLVVGFSIGGWIAAEMAVLDSKAIAGLILVDAGGLTAPGQSVLDVFSVAPSDLASFSYHAPERFRMGALTEQQAAAMRSNFAALAVYGRAQNMQDPDLHERLGSVTIPAVVVWGESDRVFTPEYGRCYAAAFPNGQFKLISECGHMPQIEQPDRLLEIVREFDGALGNRS
jgi:pimeloyl-ACP methyl ester carboxylesterase